MAQTLLSLGHGYSARALAKLLLPQGWRIIGTTRTAEKADVLKGEGIEPRITPDDDLTGDIAGASHILVSAAPSDDGDPFLLRYPEALRSAPAGWVGYLSTTGVYGDHGGAWVDEDTALSPTTHRGALRVKAEADWLATGLPVHIFRLAGIYGPGRGPFAKVRAGTARRIIKKGQIFSRIHVDDIAQVLAASIARPNSGRIYNVCDNDPAPPQDVIGHAAELLGLPLPPEVDFETADMPPMARSFYGESKRVSNARIRDELGVKLLYPSYKDGLPALLETAN
ncbi:MAG: SDR family oxidoreductase [Pseudomonadota bacterium]